MRKKIAALALGIALSVLVASVALALVSKEGTRYCNDNYIGIESLASGEVWHYWGPIGGSTWPGEKKMANSGSPLASRHNMTTLYDGRWKVTASGSLNNPGTFSYCTGVS